MTEIYDKVVGVRFAPVNKAYIFDANGYDLDLDDYVIVESVRGKQIGKVVQVKTDYVNESEPLRAVIRPATSKDLVAKELFNQKKDEAIAFAKKRLDELNMKNVKILDAEFSFDGTRLQVNYASDNDEKVDLKTLKFDLLRNFPTVSAVDLRQLGPRDVAKTVPGMGACGMACRCCCRYLTEFSSISIKMAKEQGISLTPAEITGMCGRLRCCLVYENDFYSECRKRLPKKNKHVVTPQGEGKVIEVFPLRDAVLVDIPEVGRREFKREQLTFDDQKMAAQPKEEPEAVSEPVIVTDTIISLVSDPGKTEKPEPRTRKAEEDRPERKERDRKEKRERVSGPQKAEKTEKTEKTDRKDRPFKKGDRPARQGNGRRERTQGAKPENNNADKNPAPEKSE